MRGFVESALALGRAAADLRGCRLHVCAILLVSDREHDDVAPLTPHLDLADDCPLKAAQRCTCARPAANVTVVQYVVPHGVRNGAGNPLPKGQQALLPDDATAIEALLRSLFPHFFTGGHTADANKRKPVAKASIDSDVQQQDRKEADDGQAPPPAILEDA